MAKIKVNGVMITLTDEQLHMIDEQRRQPKWDRDEALADKIDDNDRLIYRVMFLMRSWAKFHNELDGFVPDWADYNHKKWGVIILGVTYVIDYNYAYNQFLFCISVSSEQRSTQMLAEFIEDLEKIKW
jgi:hypothetical protein